MDYKKLRVDYSGRSLLEKDAAEDPFLQFSKWFKEVEDCQIKLANGMTLSTVSAENQPSSRVVLLKEISAEGLVFVSHYGSQKGQELDQNPKASALFWWPELHRQVRFQGDVKRAKGIISDRYFANRPRESNLSAMSSQQSGVLKSKQALKNLVDANREKWQDKDLVRPEGWGAFVLSPTRVEFWQGQPDRSHDRLMYRLKQGTWSMQRLFP